MYTWDQSSTKRFTINLNEPASTRWDTVLNDLALRKSLLLLMNSLESLFADEKDPPPPGFTNRNAFFQQLTTNLFLQLKHMDAEYLVDEMKGIATNLNVPVWDVALLHLLYEAEGGGCTSIVLNPNQDNTPSTMVAPPLFGRVLDWDFAPLLVPLTIEVEFVRHGNVVLEGLTFAGFIGLLTARKPNMAAVAVHFRRTLDDDHDDEDGGGGDTRTPSPPPPSPSNPAWPVALLVRHVLQAPRLETFQEIVLLFQHSPLWAPCYFVLAGTTPQEILSLTRNTCQCTATRTMDSNTSMLVQTNVDDEEQDDEGDFDFMASRHRERIVANYFSTSSREEQDETKLWQVMSLPPVLDEASVHCCVFGACCPMTSAVKATDATHLEEERRKAANLLWESSVTMLVGSVLFTVALSLFVKWTYGVE